MSFTDIILKLFELFFQFFPFFLDRSCTGSQLEIVMVELINGVFIVRKKPPKYNLMSFSVWAQGTINGDAF